MRSNTTIDYRNPNTIRRLGIDALTKELGPVGMAYFIQQFDRGEGDYTAEREELLADVTMEGLMGELEAMRQNESSTA
jgi:hypothetical protein